MLQPPPLPSNVLLAGKIAVGIGWVFGLLALLFATGSLHSIGFWVLAFFIGSHVVELAIFAPFLKAANATPADYLQVLLFGVFHSGGMKAQ